MPRRCVRRSASTTIDTIVNFAAETHVDRSILDPDAFVRTNVFGPYVLCEAVKDLKLERLHHISTDEVYGPIPRASSRRRIASSRPAHTRRPRPAASCWCCHTSMTYNLPITDDARRQHLRSLPVS